MATRAGLLAERVAALWLPLVGPVPSVGPACDHRTRVGASACHVAADMSACPVCGCVSHARPPPCPPAQASTNSGNTKTLLRSTRRERPKHSTHGPARRWSAVFSILNCIAPWHELPKSGASYRPAPPRCPQGKGRGADAPSASVWPGTLCTCHCQSLGSLISERALPSASLHAGRSVGRYRWPRGISWSYHVCWLASPDTRRRARGREGRRAAHQWL